MISQIVGEFTKATLDIHMSTSPMSSKALPCTLKLKSDNPTNTSKAWPTKSERDSKLRSSTNISYVDVPLNFEEITWAHNTKDVVNWKVQCGSSGLDAK